MVSKLFVINKNELIEGMDIIAPHPIMGHSIAQIIQISFVYKKIMLRFYSNTEKHKFLEPLGLNPNKYACVKNGDLYDEIENINQYDFNENGKDIILPIYLKFYKVPLFKPFYGGVFGNIYVCPDYNKIPQNIIPPKFIDNINPLNYEIKKIEIFDMKKFYYKFPSNEIIKYSYDLNIEFDILMDFKQSWKNNIFNLTNNLFKQITVLNKIIPNSFNLIQNDNLLFLDENDYEIILVPEKNIFYSLKKY